VRNKIYTYNELLKSIAKFPSVCGDSKNNENSDDICRLELSTMFAHMV